MKGKNGRHRTYGSNNRNSCNTVVVHMSDYKWCHAPQCHEHRTQDRIRGAKGSKVLRTRKVKQDKWNQDSFLKYFCSQGCMLQFVNTHMERIVAIAPRNQSLETPINDPVKTKHETGYGRTYYDNIITEKEVDTSMK